MAYLKIKDDVDLKELEKFGFEYKNYSGLKIWENKKGDEEIELDVYVNERHLCMNTCLVEYDDVGYNDCVVLFDLIQAGLVEKVVE